MNKPVPDNIDPEDDTAELFGEIDLDDDLDAELEDEEEDVCIECGQLLDINGLCDTEGCPANSNA